MLNLLAVNLNLVSVFETSSSFSTSNSLPKGYLPFDGYINSRMFKKDSSVFEVEVMKQDKCPYCGTEIKSQDGKRRHIYDKHPKHLKRFIERIFSERFCPGCRWLVRL